MAKFPHPPAALPALRANDIRVLPAGTELWRLYFAAGPYPRLWDEFRHFGPVGTSRFDHHDPPPATQDRGLLYAAERAPTCFAETFQATRTINRARRDPWLVAFAVERDVRVLDLQGLWPTRAGASQAISSGPRPRAREWSRSIYAQYADVDGLRYPSSMFGGAIAFALFERAEDAIPRRPVVHLPLTHPGLQWPIRRIVAELGFNLV